jgi:uncharacterized protein YbaP (TraB family)
MARTGWLRFALVLLLSLVTVACQTTPKTTATGRKTRVKQAKPDPLAPQAFFWEAKGPNGSKLYLLGSVHIGDGRELALDPRIEKDWSEAQELVVELDTTSLSELDTIGATHRHGLLPEPTTLKQVVRAETYVRLQQYVKQRGYDMDRIDQMRPWLVAQVVTGLEYDAAGLQAHNGVDAVLLRRARGQKAIVPLETLEQQMALFAGMPDALQETWLLEILREAPVLLQVTREMISAWERGDEATLERLLFGSAAADPRLAQFYANVFDSRNVAMTERLVGLAADGKSRFVVVGTGHLLGAKGIPELLAERGFDVERVGSARVVGGMIAAPAPAPSPTPPAPAAAPPAAATTPAPTTASTPLAPPATPAAATTSPAPTAVPAAPPAALPTAAPATAEPLPPAAEPTPVAAPTEAKPSPGRRARSTGKTPAVGRRPAQQKTTAPTPAAEPAPTPVATPAPAAVEPVAPAEIPVEPTPPPLPASTAAEPPPTAPPAAPPQPGVLVPDDQIGTVVAPAVAPPEPPPGASHDDWLRQDAPAR